MSLKEDESVGREADDLCRVLQDNHVQLFNNASGAKLSVGGKTFSCVCSDKNVIYQVQGKYRWFLKFSLREEWIVHEIAGAEAVNATLADFVGYQHPKAMRASIKERYTLYSAVKGKSFNRSLLEACIFGSTKSNGSTLGSMENLGRVLGLFHSYKGHSDLMVLNPSTMFYLKNYLNSTAERSDIIERIAEWVAMRDATSEATGWVHGNIKSEDIFIDDGKICLIDFGTCGIGVRYEDLANLCTYMMLFRAVPFYPWKLARKAMNALLRGYAAEADYNKEYLTSYITQGILRYYLKNIVIHSGLATISRLPIRRSHVERLVLQLLEEDYETVFEGIQL